MYGNILNSVNCDIITIVAIYMVSQNFWMVIILILGTDFEKRNLLETVMTTVTYLSLDSVKFHLLAMRHRRREVLKPINNNIGQEVYIGLNVFIYRKSFHRKILRYSDDYHVVRPRPGTTK